MSVLFSLAIIFNVFRLGICWIRSYLLINFWSREIKLIGCYESNRFNRIGDVFFLAAMDLWTICSLAWFRDYSNAYSCYTFTTISFFPILFCVRILACFLFLLLCKISPVFLHPWLPDAMKVQHLYLLYHILQHGYSWCYLLLRSPLF